MMKQCSKCGQLLNEYQFPYNHLDTTKRINICRKCQSHLEQVCRRMVQYREIECKYPAPQKECKRSYQRHVCCYECAFFKYCEYVCLNHPNKCGSKK